MSTQLNESVKNKEIEKNRMNEKVIQKLVTKCKQNKMNEFDSRSFPFRLLPFIVICPPRTRDIKMEHKLNKNKIPL